MAIQGDRVSYWLALGFFVPYLILEFIDLIWKQPRWDSRAEMPADAIRAVIMFRWITAMFALGIHVEFCLETIHFALRKSIFGAKALKANSFLTMFSPLIAVTGTFVLKY